MNGQYLTRQTNLIRRLFQAQAGLCFHCDQPMLLIVKPGERSALGASREHVFPHATTGRGMMHNIVMAHAGCNGDRGHREPSQYEIGKAAAIYKTLKLSPFIAASSPEGIAILEKNSAHFIPQAGAR